MIRSSAPRIAAAALVVLAAGCASPSPDAAPGQAVERGSGPPGAGGGPPGVAARGRGCGPLFVSPAGEPFRAEPDAAACPLRAWFSRADADGDGALSRTEFRDDAVRFFLTLDLNGDGYLDGGEVQAYETRIVPEILGRGAEPSAAVDRRPRLMRASLQGGYGGGGGMGGMGGQGGGGGFGDRGHEGPPAETGGGSHEVLRGGGGLARFSLLGEPEPVTASDLDLNGRITRAEFATRADQRFHSLDEGETGRLLFADLERRMADRAPDGRPGGGGRSGGGRGGGRGRRGAS